MIIHFTQHPIYFFSPLESSPQDFCLDHCVRSILLFILKIFNGELMIACLKIIHKKLKKLKIFEQILLHLYRHTLQTTSFSFMIFFLPHSLTYIPCLMVQLICFSRIYLQNYKFFSYFCSKMAKKNFPKFIFFLRINAILGATSLTNELKMLFCSFKNFSNRCL